jgi:hypothetical protein
MTRIGRYSAGRPKRRSARRRRALPWRVALRGLGLHGRSVAAGRRFLPVLLGLLLLALAPALAIGAQDSVVVRWTAPGDDGNVGTAAAYDLRVSTDPITAANFSAATRVDGMPAPRTAGTSQSVAVGGLQSGTTYYFALRTVDDAGNWSPISNVATWNGTFDTAPPSAPPAPGVDNGPDGVVITWSAGSEADLVGYHVYRRTEGGPTVRLTPEPITETEYVDSSPPPGATVVYYEVTAVDAAGNESAHSSGTRVEFAPTATEWKVESAYPNPSHVGQSVRFPVVIPTSVSGSARLDIVNAAGHIVRRIELASPTPGLTTVEWDGRNDAGRDVAPGVYRGWLIAGDTQRSVRLLRVP